MKETSRKLVKTTAAPSDTTSGSPSAMLKQPIPWEFLVTSSNDAITSKTPDGLFTSWNTAAERIYGYSENEILGKHVSTLIPSAHSDEFPHILEKIKRGERINHFETERKRKDGSLVDVSLTVSPINDSDGKLIGISTIARDITAQKRASQYARSLIEASLDPLVTISPDGKIADVNEATVKVTGVSWGELIGSDFSTYFTEPAKVREGYQQVFAQGFVADYPLTIRHRSGKLTDVSYNASVYKDSRGNVLGVFVAARDLTRQKQAEEELRESEQRYRALVTSTTQIVWTTDAQGAVIDMPSWREFTGQTCEEVKGTAWITALHPDDRDRAMAVWREAVERKSLYATEYRVRRHDGVYRHFSARGVPILKVDGTIREWVGMCTDVTEHRKSEEALQRITWMLGHHRKRGSEPQYHPPYGDLLQLNTAQLVLGSVGEAVLQDIVSDYLDLLDTSAAVYEKNGDYALGIFSSGWCRMMDAASRARCGTGDNREALASGKWHCHESCWTQASKVSMETEGPADIECQGGIRLYAMPIRAGNTVVGSINFGYGDPPRDEAKLQELSARYGISVEDLRVAAAAYESRPPYIIEQAKRRLEASARLIGEIIQRKQAEETLQRLNAELEQRVAERTAQLDLAIEELKKQRALIESIHQAETEFIAAEFTAKNWEQLLDRALALTESEYGFIDELFHTPEGAPYLIARAITDISWNEETRALYPKFLSGELRFSNLNSLFGAVMVTKRPVIANDAANDPRRCGIPPGHPALIAFLGLPLFSGQEMVGVMGLANRPGGYTEEFVANLAPMVTAFGNMLGAWRNEQRRKQAEADLLQSNTNLKRQAAALDAVNQELEAFSYSASHDLRAPLRSIDGFSQAVLEDYDDKLDDQGRDYLTRVRTATQHMAELIDNMLSLSRVTRDEIHPAAVDLGKLAYEIADELRRSNPDRRVTFVIAEGMVATGDPGLLRLALANLLENAWKFSATHPTSRIEVGSINHNGCPAYFVKDDGAGFDMAYVEKLFKPFQRLHSSQEFPGTGIGLATVQRIIHRHSGKVWAESAVGQGATFFFTLPT